MEESFEIEIEFATKVQVKGLTHIFCFIMSSSNVYKKDAFSLNFTFKILCHLGRVQRSLTLTAKHKIKIFTCLVFNSLSFQFFYFSTCLPTFLFR